MEYEKKASLFNQNSLTTHRQPVMRGHDCALIDYKGSQGKKVGNKLLKLEH